MVPMIRVTDELIKVDHFRKKRMKELEELDLILFHGFRKGLTATEKREGIEIRDISYLESLKPKLQNTLRIGRLGKGVGFTFRSEEVIF